jgi:hypothetical protein
MIRIVQPLGELIIDGSDRSSAWRHMGDKFNGRRATFEWSEIYGILIVLALIAAVVLIAYVVQWFVAKYSQQPHPRRLFRELCQVHRLTRRERRTLREASHTLEQPNSLFVRPELLGEDAAVLRAKLFADVID